MPVSVRPLRPADKDAWEPLWRGYLEFYGYPPTPERTETLWQRLMAETPNVHCLVAVDQEARLVGMTHYLFHVSTLDPRDKCYLQDLFVDPDCRTAGAGRALIEAVYNEAATAGAYEVYWTTQTFNSVARVLYDRVADLTPFIKYRKEIN